MWSFSLQVEQLASGTLHVHPCTYGGIVEEHCFPVLPCRMSFPNVYYSTLLHVSFSVHPAAQPFS